MKTRVAHVNDNVPGAVYIGRAVPRKGIKHSRWANAFVIGTDGDRTEVIRKYRELSIEPDLRRRRAATIRELRKLAGKPLACWCRHDGEERTEDNACHGDVLVELIQALGLEASR